MAIKSMFVDELKPLLDKKADIVLVDCREQEEWDAGHIAQALFIPLSQFDKSLDQLKNKNAKIILQCRSGKRSLRAAEFLEAQGYTDLTNLEGGILDWEGMGHPVVTK